MLYCNLQCEEGISLPDLKEKFVSVLEGFSDRNKILLIPPDTTRLHSRAGELTEAAWEFFQDRVQDILPALGTHIPLTEEETGRMFGKTPKHLFRVHNWRNGLTTLGTVPKDFIRQVSGGILDFSWPVQVNSLFAEGGHDLILSIGQVVPHEVTGMANYNKNIFVGLGGKDSIDISHFLGAAYGMERIMGRADNPVRAALNYASEHFISHLPVLYVLTVLARNKTGELVPVGLVIGDDAECFYQAAGLSGKTNITLLDKPLKKAVVYLDPEEFKSTWLGNKSIYRTRMAIDDGGELVILAPGIGQFGEDERIDGLIRKYGYSGTEHIMEQISLNEDLKNNLSAAAHLIHGSSEGRFTVRYCPGSLSREEIEKAGYSYGYLEEMMKTYNPKKLTEGYNKTETGEDIYFISNPATGLWVYRERFRD